MKLYFYLHAMYLSSRATAYFHPFVFMPIEAEGHTGSGVWAGPARPSFLPHSVCLESQTTGADQNEVFCLAVQRLKSSLCAKHSADPRCWVLVEPRPWEHDQKQNGSVGVVPLLIALGTKKLLVRGCDYRYTLMTSLGGHGIRPSFYSLALLPPQ